MKKGALRECGVALLMLALAGAHEIAARPAAVKGAPQKRKRAEEEARKEENEVPPPEEKAGDARPNFYVFAPLLGTWETRSGGGKRLVIEPGGAFRVSGAETDSGVTIARFGQMPRKSPKTGGRWLEGTFKLHSLSKLETGGAFGRHVWQRVK